MKRQVLCLKTNQFHKRGSKYNIFSCNKVEESIELVIYDELNRKRIVETNNFDFLQDEVINCTHWVFDDQPEEIDENFFSWLEITLHMSDGSKRWCKLYTPSSLAKVLERNDIDPPGIGLNGFIAVRSFKTEDIQRMIKYLEDENELEEYSLPYEK